MMSTVVLIATTTLCGLLAGLFFVWSIAIIPALKRMSDDHYLTFMQTVNRTILNPLFFMSFFGPVILLPLCTYLYMSEAFTFQLLVVASIFYIICVFGVTAFGNVPLNNSLEAVSLKSLTNEDLKRRRYAYEQPWNRLNHLRASFSVIVLVLTIISCVGKIG